MDMAESGIFETQAAQHSIRRRPHKEGAEFSSMSNSLAKQRVAAQGCARRWGCRGLPLRDGDFSSPGGRQTAQVDRAEIQRRPLHRGLRTCLHGCVLKC